MKHDPFFSWLIALSLAFAVPAAFAADAPTTASPPAVIEARLAQRDLWVEHAFWIRSYVLAGEAGDTAQQSVAEAQVIANAQALAASIVPFYGEEAGDGLLSLLAGHWGAVQRYATATFEGSGPDQASALQQLTANAKEIAEFLSSANPFLPTADVFGLLSMHGEHHVQQIHLIAADRFDDEAVTWASMRKHMLVIADAITQALARQFPDRFTTA